MQIKKTAFTLIMSVLLTAQVYSQNLSADTKVNVKTAKTDYKYFIRTSYYGFTNWNGLMVV